MTARLRLPRPTFRGLRTSTSRYLDLIEDNLPSHPRSKRPSVQNLSTDLPTQAPNPTQQPNPTQPNRPTNTTQPPDPTDPTQPTQPNPINPYVYHHGRLMHLHPRRSLGQSVTIKVTVSILPVSVPLPVLVSPSKPEPVVCCVVRLTRSRTPQAPGPRLVFAPASGG